MAEDLAQIMAERTDAELQELVRDRKKYQDDAILAAINELEKRGFTSEDLSNIKKQYEQLIGGKAPLLYSEMAVYGFAFFFSTIFGAFLLMQNFKVLKKDKAVNATILFGLGYTFAGVLILSLMPPNPFFSILFNLLGAFLLKRLFWDKYIGPNYPYQKKSLRTPLLISIGLVLLIFALTMMTGKTPF